MMQQYYHKYIYQSEVCEYWGSYDKADVFSYSYRPFTYRREYRDRAISMEQFDMTTGWDGSTPTQFFPMPLIFMLDSRPMGLTECYETFDNYLHWDSLEWNEWDSADENTSYHWHGKYIACHDTRSGFDYEKYPTESEAQIAWDELRKQLAVIRYENGDG